MGTPDLERVRAVWREVPDGDVVRGLRAAEDYPPEVVRIIEAEVAARGLDVEAWPAESWGSHDCRAGGAAAPAGALFCAATAVSVYWGLRRTSDLRPFRRDALRVGDVPGYDVAALHSTVSHISERIDVHLLAIRRYQAILKAIATACSIQMAVVISYNIGVLITMRFWFAPTLGLTLLIWLMAVVAIGVIPFGLLAGVTHFRNRFSPVHPQGCCERCGYDLRGLPVPRCPECGTPFDPTSVRRADGAAD